MSVKIEHCITDNDSAIELNWLRELNFLIQMWLTIFVGMFTGSEYLSEYFTFTQLNLYCHFNSRRPGADK